MDWVYGQIVGFLGNFFALMGNMGVELFELEWVEAILLFFSRLAWALFAVSVVVCALSAALNTPPERVISSKQRSTSSRAFSR